MRRQALSIPAEFYEAVRADYPRWKEESLPHYLERVAVLVGAMKREDSDEIGPEEDIKAREGRARPKTGPSVRLPYRDDVDEPRIADLERSQSPKLKASVLPPAGTITLEVLKAGAAAPLPPKTFDELFPVIAPEVVKEQRARNEVANAVLAARSIPKPPQPKPAAPPPDDEEEFF